MLSYGIQFKPDFTMIADWELAERNAFHTYFDMLLFGCLFHMGKQCNLMTHTLLRYFWEGQAMWRKVQELGLATSYIKECKVRFFEWHLLSMAHLPLEDHALGLQIIEEDLQLFEDDSGINPSSMRLFQDARDLYRCSILK